MFAAIAILAAVAQAGPVARSYGGEYTYAAAAPSYGQWSFDNSADNSQCVQGSKGGCRLTTCSASTPANQMINYYPEQNNIKFQTGNCMVVQGPVSKCGAGTLVVSGKCGQCNWQVTAAQQYQLAEAPKFCIGYNSDDKLCLVKCAAAPAMYYYTPAAAAPVYQQAQPEYQAYQPEYEQPAYQPEYQQPSYGQDNTEDNSYGYGRPHGYGYGNYDNNDNTYTSDEAPAVDTTQAPAETSAPTETDA